MGLLLSLHTLTSHTMSSDIKWFKVVQNVQNFLVTFTCLKLSLLSNYMNTALFIVEGVTEWFLYCTAILPCIFLGVPLRRCRTETCAPVLLYFITKRKRFLTSFYC